MENLIGKELLSAFSRSELNNPESWTSFLTIKKIIDSNILLLEAETTDRALTMNVSLTPEEMSALANGDMVHLDFAEKKTMGLQGRRGGSKKMFHCINRGWFKIENVD